tara:strand:- start:296 stop:736 length:441 start_codon:yes stop_codon:yes gene_type:complete
MSKVYRGQIDDQPKTVTGVTAGAYQPATMVTFNGTTLTAATAVAATPATGARLFILDNLGFLGGDIDTAIASGDTAQAYRIQPEQEYQVEMAAATYTYGQKLSVGAGGRLEAAATGDLVVAYLDQAGATLSAGDLADVVIAAPYTM